MHARAISVEDARNLDAQFMLTPIIEKERLSTALSFIIAGAWANRIYVAPIILCLRMDVRIPVNLRRRRLKNFRFHSLGKGKHVDRAVHAGFSRLYWITLIVDR